MTIDGVSYIWKDESDCSYDEDTFGEEEGDGGDGDGDGDGKGGGKGGGSGGGGGASQNGKGGRRSGDGDGGDGDGDGDGDDYGSGQYRKDVKKKVKKTQEESASVRKIQRWASSALPCGVRVVSAARLFLGLPAVDCGRESISKFDSHTGGQ